jgi:hypothetical protein
VRQVFLIANLDNPRAAQRLAEDAKKYPDAREDVSTQPRLLVKDGRVSVVGIPQKIADELRTWCAERIKLGEQYPKAFARRVPGD